MDKNISSKKFDKNFRLDAAEFLSSSFYKQCWLAGLIHAGMSNAERLEKVSYCLGVCVRTVRRWFDGDSEPHPSAVRLLLAHHEGVPLGLDWQGWRVTGGQLVSPTGFAVTPEIENRIWWLTNELRQVRHELAVARVRVRELEKSGSGIALHKIQAAVSMLESVVSA